MDKEKFDKSLESLENNCFDIKQRLGLHSFFSIDQTPADVKGNIDAIGIDYFGNTYRIQHKYRGKGIKDFCFELEKETMPTHPLIGVEYKYSLHMGKANYLTYELDGKLYIFDMKVLSLLYTFQHRCFVERWVKEDNGYSHPVCFIERDKLLELYRDAQDFILTRNNFTPYIKEDGEED